MARSLSPPLASLRTLISQVSLLIAFILAPAFTAASTAPTTPTFVLTWGNYGTAPGQFFSPGGVGVDALGNVYVADQFNNRVQKFDRYGNFLAQWGTYGAGTGQFNQPYAVTADRSGNVYVVDLGNARIQKFTATGGFLTQWGGFGTGNGQFKEPIAVATDASANVYVVDARHAPLDRRRRPPLDGS